MSPRRRAWLGGGVALAAAGAGGGWRWWQGHAGPDDGTDAPDDLWSLRFTRPEGGELSLAASRGQPLLINFWATWCAPCVKELPQIDRFYREFAPKGWSVIALAIDSPTPVREFLRRMPLGFAVGLAGLEGTDLSKRLGNTRGALPFSIGFDRRGSVRQRKLGETSYEELVTWAETIG